MADPYTQLNPGTRLWHVYPKPFPSTSFNPKSAARFAQPGHRAMYYAGDSSDVVLWETVLRNLVLDGTPVSIDDKTLAPWMICEVEVTQQIPVIDIRAPHFRRLSTNPADHTEWQHLCVVPEAQYAATHACAMDLLRRFPSGAALSWPSRQFSSGRVLVLYEPPLNSAVLRERFPHELLTRRDLVADALERVGVDLLDVPGYSSGLPPIPP